MIEFRMIRYSYYAHCKALRKSPDQCEDTRFQDMRIMCQAICLFIMAYIFFQFVRCRL